MNPNCFRNSQVSWDAASFERPLAPEKSQSSLCSPRKHHSGNSSDLGEQVRCTLKGTDLSRPLKVWVWGRVNGAVAPVPAEWLCQSVWVMLAMGLQVPLVLSTEAQSSWDKRVPSILDNKPPPQKGNT